MEKRTIGLVFIEGSENVLTIRRTYFSAWILPLMAICFSYLLFNFVGDTIKHGWHWKDARFLFYGVLCLPLVVSEITLLQARLILDWTTSRVRDRSTELGELVDFRRAEVTAFTDENLWKSRRLYAVILRRRDGIGTQPTVRDLMVFKRETQAREIADILNAFLQQPAPTETPGVWPPPPRRAERPADPPTWKRAGKKNDDATH